MQKENDRVKEIVLQQFWNAKMVFGKQLKTTENKTIIILNFGTLNNAQGPDFLEAEVEIDGVRNYGAIEIHVNASEWFKHNHHHDEKYNAVILHVIWANDKIARDKSGRILPILELKKYFTEKELQNSQLVKMQNVEFPCQQFHHQILLSDKYQQLTFAQAERWNRKAEEVIINHHKFKGDWQKVILVQFAKYWVDSQNRNSMIWLAENSVISRMQRFSHNEMLAYWLGRSQIKFENQVTRSKEIKIIETYVFLQRKFDIETPKLNWYFGKIRPNAFPNIRLWQWAQWLMKNECNLSKWLALKSYEELIEELSTSSEWINSKSKETEIIINGMQHIQQLIINAVVPIWLAYGKIHHNQTFADHGIQILERISPETNNITRKMNWLSIMNYSAKNSQQLMAQYEHYCKPKKCLECIIGQNFLK
jgi:hypothetical protein